VNPATRVLQISSHGTVELKIPGRAEWVAVARLAGAAVASRLRFSVDEIEDIKLAIAEACTNSIQAAGGVDAGTIEIVCDAAEDELRVTVRDSSTGPHLESTEPGGLVEGRTEAVRQAIAEFAAFMDGTGSVGRAMTADTRPTRAAGRNS